MGIGFLQGPRRQLGGGIARITLTNFRTTLPNPVQN